MLENHYSWHVDMRKLKWEGAEVKEARKHIIGFVALDEWVFSSNRSSSMVEVFY